MNISELSAHLDSQENHRNAVWQHLHVRVASLTKELEGLEGKLANLERHVACRLGRVERALPAAAVNGTGQVLVLEMEGGRHAVNGVK
jgi:hypothetical protein